MNDSEQSVPYALEALEAMAEYGCANPHCKHQHKPGEVFLVQKCHPITGVNVSYVKGSGVLTIKCHTCEALVAEISVNLLPIRYA